MKRFFSLFTLVFAIVLNIAAQTFLCTYKGGYFVRDANIWYEYRPESSSTVWAEYTQSSSDDNYYYIKNKFCSLSIPKAKQNNIYQYNDRLEKWEVIYNTINVFSRCPVRSSQIFTHNDGFFVKKGSRWFRYNPAKISVIRDSLVQYKADNDFYYIRGRYSNEFAIPRKASNDFHFKSKSGEWEKLYTTQALYDSYSPEARSGNNYVAQNVSSSKISSVKKSNAKTYREELGYGMFAIVTEYGKDTYTKAIYSRCSICRGTTKCGSCYGRGRCSVCRGTGNMYHGLSDSGYYPCSLCQGTGVCGTCKGSGVCPCAKLDYPGYLLSNVLNVTPYGVFSTAEGRSGSSQDRNDNSGRFQSNGQEYSRSNCPKCGGTGIDPQAHEGSYSGQISFLGYSNSVGNVCPYCSKPTRHHHTKCMGCNVPGY